MVLKERFIFFCIGKLLILRDKIATIDANILTGNKDSIVNTPLFGKPNSENSFNKSVLNASIESILSTERFRDPLF